MEKEVIKATPKKSIKYSGICEKVSKDLVVRFNENAEAVGCSQLQLVGNVLNEIPDLGAGGHLKDLKHNGHTHTHTRGRFFFLSPALAARREFVIPRPCRWESGLCGRFACCSAGWRPLRPGAAEASWPPFCTMVEMIQNEKKNKRGEAQKRRSTSLTRVCGGSSPDLNELCSRCTQSEASGSVRRDSRNRCACFRSGWLGGKRPQHNHSSCQPCSTLNLQMESEPFMIHEGV